MFAIIFLLSLSVGFSSLTTPVPLSSTTIELPDIENESLLNQCLQGYFEPTAHIMDHLYTTVGEIYLAIDAESKVLVDKLNDVCTSDSERLQVKNCIAAKNAQCARLSAAENTKIQDSILDIADLMREFNKNETCVREESFLTYNFMLYSCINVDCSQVLSRKVRSPDRGINVKSIKIGQRRDSGDSSGDEKERRNKQKKLPPKRNNRRQGKNLNRMHKHLKTDLHLQLCSAFDAQISLSRLPQKCTCTGSPQNATIICKQYETAVIDLSAAIVKYEKRATECIQGNSRQIQNVKKLDDLFKLC